MGDSCHTLRPEFCSRAGKAKSGCEISATQPCSAAKSVKLRHRLPHSCYVQPRLPDACRTAEAAAATYPYATAHSACKLCRAVEGYDESLRQASEKTHHAQDRDNA